MVVARNAGLLLRAGCFAPPAHQRPPLRVIKEEVASIVDCLRCVVSGYRSIGRSRCALLANGARAPPARRPRARLSLALDADAATQERARRHLLSLHATQQPTSKRQNPHHHLGAGSLSAFRALLAHTHAHAHNQHPPHTRGNKGTPSLPPLPPVRLSAPRKHPPFRRRTPPARPSGGANRRGVSQHAPAFRLPGGGAAQGALKKREARRGRGERRERERSRARDPLSRVPCAAPCPSRRSAGRMASPSKRREMDVMKL